MLRFLLVSVACAGSLLLAGGCSVKKNPEIPKSSADNLQTIYQTYNKAAEQLNRGPKDLAEFKKFLPPGTSADEILTSPHDGKPYKLVWNVNPRTPPKEMYAILIAYEQEGKDGEFDIVTTMGILRCKQDELKKFIAATPGAGQS